MILSSDCIMSVDTVIALVALVMSVIALGISIYFWRRTFRPLVTASIKTNDAGNVAIFYDLVLANSGSIPARKIKLISDLSVIEKSLGRDATPENRRRWLSCFEKNTVIGVLQNGEKISCSFGTSSPNDAGFWKYKSTFPIVIEYEGWFGKKYKQEQELAIVDLDSFTGFMWGK